MRIDRNGPAIRAAIKKHIGHEPFGLVIGQQNPAGEYTPHFTEKGCEVTVVVAPVGDGWRVQ